MARERPIVFSSPMVRALLAGTKTQTRRILTPQPPDGYWRDETERHEPGHAGWLIDRCPYGRPGDRLWVREGFRLIERRHPTGPDRDTAIYVADGEPTMLDTWPWKRETQPAIYMPRGLCRIELDVTAVRVERLQTITEEDARAEGVDGGSVESTAEKYAWLWDEINGKRAAWASNPWVWAMSFRLVNGSAR